MYDDLILFAVEGGRAVEVTTTGIEFADDINPLFANSKVTKPVPVMVEGTYQIFDAASKAWRKIVITAQDIAEYLANTPRDVAINYDHQRGGAAKGWLRLKDTGRVATVATRQGQKTALVASMELFDQAAQDVQRGLFRDVSIELKPISKEIIGNALTSYPIMRDVQFYSDAVPGAEEIADGAVANATDPGALSSENGIESPSTFAQPEAAPPVESSPQETVMDEATRQSVLAEALQQYGLKLEDLTSLPDAVKALRQAEAEARFSAARAKIQALAGEGDKAKLAPGAVTAAAHLLAFCEEHAEVQFSVEGAQVNPAALLESVLNGVQAVQIFGAITEEGEPVSTAEGEPPVPATQDFDPARAKSLAARIKRNISND